MDIVAEMQSMGHSAKTAAEEVARSPIDLRNQALLAIRETIDLERDAILEANRTDLARGLGQGLEAALLDRLELTPSRIESLLESLSQVAELPDPIGKIEGIQAMPSGISVGTMRVPLGVIGIIYESRPNVTIEAAALCLKAGNAVILRGGSEAISSNTKLGEMIAIGLRQAGLPVGVAQVVPVVDREAVGALLKMSEHLDLIVPRGGKGLIQRVSAESRVPVLKHLDGICHVYLDEEADPDKAYQIALNAKTQRYGTCNTMETLLVARSFSLHLPKIVRALQAKGVEIRGCADSRIASPDINVEATEADWGAEYLAPILSVRIVEGIDQAIQHIAQYGSNHTESIVTENAEKAARFLREVDSSSVMHNVSTRFADGFEYGLGAEIGISTDKLHARGPVGLEGLTSRKYIVIGNGNIRE